MLFGVWGELSESGNATFVAAAAPECSRSLLLLLLLLLGGLFLATDRAAADVRLWSQVRGWAIRIPELA
jgi:hypothetical protein